MEEKIIDFKEYFHKGLASILTDRGNHYFKTLRSQYLRGLPIKDEKLMVLSVLLVHSEKFDLKDFTEEEVLVTEIQENVGEFDSIHVAEQLERYGYMERNPEYDPMKGKLMSEAIGRILDKID